LKKSFVLLSPSFILKVLGVNIGTLLTALQSMKFEYSAIACNSKTAKAVSVIGICFVIEKKDLLVFALAFHLV